MAAVRLYVSGIPFNMGEIELLEIFSNHTLVKDVHLVKENGKNIGYGFIHLEDPKAADRTIAALNGKLIGGHKLNVKLALEKPAANQKQFLQKR